jgi:hypothetical protein
LTATASGRALKIGQRILNPWEDRGEEITMKPAILILILAGAANAQTKPTATEIFNLRTKCGELAERIREWQQKEGVQSYLGTKAYVSQTSNYDAQTNRCYAEITTSITSMHEDKLSTTDFVDLYDAQSRQQLAGAYWGTLAGKPWGKGGSIGTGLIPGDDAYEKAMAFIEAKMERR